MNKTICRVALFGMALASVAMGADADAKVARTGQPSVSFTAVGPGGLKFVGTTSDLNVNDTGSTISVVIPLARLNTGIELRDKHMRDKYLEVGAFPNAELQVDRGALKLPAPGADVSSSAQGTLMLHGKSKPVAFQYTAKRQGNAIHVTGSLRLNMKDHGIEVPSYLGVTVKPDIDVSVSFDASDSG